MSMIPEPIISILTFASVLFVFMIGAAALAIIIMAALDLRQGTNAIRRNFPVIGRFRHLFEHLGVFFRQYFFAMDREEMPFNRQQRNWVDSAAKDKDKTASFGSTRDLTPAGTVFFVNCMFPTLDEDAAPTRSVVIGPQARHPFETARHFHISGMSYGALSKVAVETLSRGAAMAGCWMNTGEGGLSPYHLKGGCDIVFQIGTAKYGVRDEQGRLSDEKLRQAAAHENVRMFEIKLSQGAKPGKGGILPGNKVTAEIAAIRGIPEGQDSISPNRHVEIDSVGDLLDMVARIRDVTGKPTGFKTVIGSYGWLDALIEEINRRGHDSAPDFITVDSADGGTGAAPSGLIDYMGIPIAESLPLVVDRLTEAGLKDRIKIVASGKLVTAADVTWALCMGADFAVSARGFMFALGCIQAMKCASDKCPTGITTHNTRLQRGLDPTDKAARVASYVENLSHEVEIMAHSCGVAEPRQLRRYHARIVQSDGRSVSLTDIYPDKKPLGAAA